MDNISVLQKVRYQYQPRVPGEITRDVSKIVIKKGAPTESVSDQDAIKKMFKNTYGKPIVEFVEGDNKNAAGKINVGGMLNGKSLVGIFYKPQGSNNGVALIKAGKMKGIVLKIICFQTGGVIFFILKSEFVHIHFIPHAKGIFFYFFIINQSKPELTIGNFIF